MTILNWWEREGLRYVNGRLHLGAQDLTQLAHSAGTPTFAYHAPRAVANLDRLHDALDAHDVPHTIFYALKCNRFLPLVTYLRLNGRCHIDVCSPNELLLARQLGFREDEIIYTSTSVANEDLDLLQRHPNVHINCDAISTIRRLGERCAGRTIGIRINPQFSPSHLQNVSYGGSKATKFGIYQDRFAEAVTMAQRYDLHIDTLHFHSASGYLTAELEQFEELLRRTEPFLAQCDTITKVDIGGGLGVPLSPDDAPLDLDRWAAILAAYSQRHGVQIQLEPGDYVMKDTAVLLLQVNTVEEKGGTTFVGVNGGFSISSLYAYYKYPMTVAPIMQKPDAPLQTVTLAGNINESIDLLGEDVVLPQVEEGDILALMNIGGYSTAMSSNHCMRGEFSEYLVVD